MTLLIFQVVLQPTGGILLMPMETLSRLSIMMILVVLCYPLLCGLLIIIHSLGLMTIYGQCMKTVFSLSLSI